MKVSIKTDVGVKKKVNQDFFYVSPSKNLFIIADGMGGHKAGEVASNLAVSTIVEELEDIEDLRDYKKIRTLIIKAISKANSVVFFKSKEEKGYEGMGTTVSLAYLYEDIIFIGHVGDSRIYLISEDQIEQVTEDHSLVKELLKQGSITETEAYHHPQKNIITRAVGTSDFIEVDTFIRKLNGEKFLVLTTDGLTNEVSDETIKNYFLNKRLDIASSELIDLSKERGSYDNITIIAAQINELR